MHKLALTISEACEVARASRTSLYNAIARGELTARKRGRRTLVLVEDLRNWVEGLPKLSSKALSPVVPNNNFSTN
jgi:excisionase family DNA binding protein